MAVSARGGGGRGLWCVCPWDRVGEWARRERCLHAFLDRTCGTQERMVELSADRPMVDMDLGDVKVRLQLLDPDWRERGLFKCWTPL